MKFHLAWFLFLTNSVVEADISYNRDVRPILSDACFHCHGPDKGTRKPKSDPMRLDSIDGATQDQGGYAAIVPGKPEESELILRIFAKDPDDLMPPVDSHRSLTKKQKEILRQWIKEGAKYERHWSFVPPKQSKPPAVTGSTWPRNEIDQFVLEYLTANKLQPTSAADKATLIRRASLSLTGLQPTPREADEFIADKSPQAYGKLLDRLLASPRYGERMAYPWIEAARYADTDGYQNDGGRTMWPWRDWVIKAFNDNMGYDQFTIRQLAGDMLPNKTQQDILASAFNRNHRINNEGGALPEEFIVEYAVDRVETTSSIWLGLTAGCARCHDHKYDPLSQKQFFQLYAYFNNIPENGKAAGANATPIINVGSPLYRDQATEKLVESVRKKIADMPAGEPFKKRQVAWEKTIRTQLVSEKSPWRLGELMSFKASSLAGSGKLVPNLKLTPQGGGGWLTNKSAQNTSYAITLKPPSGMKTISTLRLDALQHRSLKKPLRFSHSSGGNFFISEISLKIKRAGELIPVKLGRAVTNFSQLMHSAHNITDGKAATGWAVADYKGKAPLTVHIPVAEPVALQADDVLVVQMDFPNVKNPSKNPVTKPPHESLASFRLSFHTHSSKGKENNHFSNTIADLLDKTPATRSPEEKKNLQVYYAKIDPPMQKLLKQKVALDKKISSLTVRVPVMQEKGKPAPTYLLERGQYHSPDKSEALKREVPPWINSSGKQPANRLELARWLVSSENPLAARVTVNRIWQQHFGVGLVRTADNFGLQGEAPSHPELLDWLAVDFMENGWNIKRLHKQILSSATWQQSSHASKQAYVADPNNRLISRGPRIRLSAVAIRDTALFAGGLLHEQLGGPPVRPYQPKGLWEEMAHAPNIRYKASKGQNLYRRDLYTYWKRAVNPPRMILFDAASRDYCTVVRKSTNTPLQALATMNDLTFVEAARQLGARMLKSKHQRAEAKLVYGFKLALGRSPTTKELDVVKACYKDFWNYYRGKPKQAAAYLKHGSKPADTSLNAPEHAAYMAAGHLMLNMDSALHLE